MKKSKHYYNTRFTEHVIKEAHSIFLSKLNQELDISAPSFLDVTIGDESWGFETLEEFLAEYPRAKKFRIDHRAQGNCLTVESLFGNEVSVYVSFTARHDIEAIFQIFERNLDHSKLIVKSTPVKVFIGHGQDKQWRDLKDHLHDLHGFEVIAYEIGPRAGLSVKEVLEDMLNESSFALLVLTGEDQHADGELHARENVIHELGLFQGKLGFTRAIAILEESVKEFSNIFGINQIRFARGRIRETFGDVLATIKREFEKR